jgi:hypothetical protein
MVKAGLSRFPTALVLAALLLACSGCDRGLEGRIEDTVFFALRIADIWV